MKKLILTDADGCILDWEGAFALWMIKQGHEYTPKATYKLHHHFKDLSSQELDAYVNEFCGSEQIRHLKPFLDAKKYLKILHEKHGYKFKVITSIGSDPEIRERREENLRNLFGDAIQDVVCLDQGSEKDLILEPYRDSNLFWVEDKYENFLTGLRLGLNSILMRQDHNRNQRIRRGLVAHNWQEIYQIVLASLDSTT